MVMKQFAERLENGYKKGKGVYIAPSANVIGEVIMGDHVSIWHNAVIRGDINNIIIGNRSNVQDCSILHVSRINNLIIGNNVTIGHGVNLHGCVIKDNVLVGIGSIVLDEAIISENCIIAAGSIVTPRTIIPAGSMVMGAPARVVRQLTEVDLEKIKENADHYIDYKNIYLEKGL